MDPERWKQVEAILQSAMDLSPEELEPFLRERCKGDAELEGEIRHLLSVDRRAGSFLQGRAISQAPWAFDSNANPTLLAEGGAGSIVGDFQIVEKLGAGGMGVVYKAQDRRLGRFVALKFLGRKFAGDPAALSRFQREAQAASALNHPNICTFYDIGEHEGGAFLVMEYVAGKTLEALIPRSGLRLQQLLPIAIQVAEGISAAHSAGIIHRDLKPSNIMVTDNGVVKVLDFGLAKLTERPSASFSQAAGQEDTQTLADQTAAGVVMGTAAYMSPEQVEARPVDARSDVFSFGAMLYEMATGRRAFPGDSTVAAMSAVLNQEPKPLTDLAPGLPPEFERLVTRCLRKDPRNRQQHVSDLKVLLEELKQESESGKSVSPAPTRRIKARAAAAALLLSAAGAGLWFWPRQQPPPRLVALRTFAGSESHPSFSPDGNQVAFSWDGEKQDNWDIYVKMVGSASALRLTTGAADDLYPSWSPDGKQIAFLKYAAKTGIYLISALGGPEQKIVDFDAAPGLPVWSPDGKFLIAAQSSHENKPEPGAGALVLIPVESGEPRVILTPSVGRIYQYPAISPDGRSLAFASCQGVSTARACDVSTVNLNAGLLPQGGPRHVTAARGFISGLVWAADGRSLIYSAGTSGAIGDGYLWRVGVRGGEPVRMEIAGQGARFPAVTAKRRERLVFARSMGDEDIWRLHARRQNHIVRQVFGMIGSKHFSDAREMVQKIEDSSIGSQVRTLIDFGETTAALDTKDTQWAFTLSNNSIRGGIKRALLYAGMTVSARDPQEALSYFGLGIHDTEQLPAEQRMVTTMALMNSILGRDIENGILALSLFVRAANDAYTKPHQGRFEPDVVRKIYSQSATTSTDSALILANQRCLCEVVDTGRGRHTFGLKVPGVETATLSGASANLSQTDFQRLEGILAGIRDESLMSSQLNILAALRLRSRGAATRSP